MGILLKVTVAYLTNHHVACVELASVHYRRPISVLTYNDVFTDPIRKSAAIFATLPTTSLSKKIAAIFAALPISTITATKRTETRADKSGLWLLMVRSTYDNRLSALEALLEALEMEDVIGRSLAGLEVKDTKTCV